MNPTLAITSRTSPRLYEKIFRLFCARGKLLSETKIKKSKKQPKCVMFHHNNPYLKFGPFNTEIISFRPYRAMFHNVSFLYSDLGLKMTL